jgi:hypothetical protein
MLIAEPRGAAKDGHFGLRRRTCAAEQPLERDEKSAGSRTWLVGGGNRFFDFGTLETATQARVNQPLTPWLKKPH